MPLPGRRNRFYSIGVFGRWEERKEEKEKEKRKMRMKKEVVRVCFFCYLAFLQNKTVVTS